MTLESGTQLWPYLGESIPIFILNIETPEVKTRDLLLQLKKAHQPKILLIVSRVEITPASLSK